MHTESSSSAGSNVDRRIRMRSGSRKGEETGGESEEERVQDARGVL